MDFCCYAASLVIELDGAVHNNQVEYDAARDATPAARDVLILRFTNTEAETDISSVLARIRQSSQERIQAQ